MSDWKQIVLKNEKMVFGTAWRILGHVQDTEDAVQDVYLQAHSLYGRHRVRHWPALLRRLATCRALDRLRRRRATVPLDDAVLPGREDGPEEALAEKELVERLREVIGQLPEREGEVFCLHYFEQLPFEEIAEALDVSRGAVSTALYRARERLETLITSHWR